MTLRDHLPHVVNVYNMQALVRQLDHGKVFRIPLDSLQELTGKVCTVPARVGPSFFHLTLHKVNVRL